MGAEWANAGAALVNVLLTIFVVLFSRRQWRVMDESERDRVRQRDKEWEQEQVARNRSLDEAYYLVWAEHFRLDNLANRWETGDLIEFAYYGLMHPEDVQARDWKLVVEMLSRFGPEAAFLGGVASTLSSDVTHEITSLIAKINSFSDGFQNATFDARFQFVKPLEKSLEPSIIAIRRGTRQLSLLLWDALLHSPTGKTVRTLNFRDEITSESGRQAVASLRERSRRSGEYVRPTSVDVSLDETSPKPSI